MIRVESLTLTRGKRQILGPLSFVIEQSRWLSVVGANGAGKSTLLRLIAGIDVPSGGDVKLKDQSVTSLAPLNRAQHIGYLAQISATPLLSQSKSMSPLAWCPMMERRSITVR